MVVSILAVKNKPSKRGGKRVRSNTGNSSEKHENPWIAAGHRVHPSDRDIFPHRRINWLLFAPQLRERCVNAISTRLWIHPRVHPLPSLPSIQPLNPRIRYRAPNTYKQLDKFTYLSIPFSPSLSLMYSSSSIRRSKEARGDTDPRA